MIPSFPVHTPLLLRVHGIFLNKFHFFHVFFGILALLLEAWMKVQSRWGQSVFRVTGLKILGRVGAHKKKFWKKYNFMHFEKLFAFQNA